MTPVGSTGIRYDPIHASWQLDEDDLRVNYVLVATPTVAHPS